MNLSAITYDELITNPALLAGFVELYNNRFNTDLCVTCKGKIKSAWLKYNQDLSLLSTKNENMNTPNNCDYRIKGNKMIRVHNGAPYTNDNLTNEAVNDLLAKYPNLIDQLERVDGQTIGDQAPAKPKPSAKKQPKINATASAIAYAEENNIKLEDVTGSGTGGRITLNDVKK